MGKSRVMMILLATLLLMFFSATFIFQNKNFNFTGFAIYSSGAPQINDTYIRSGSDSNFGNSVKMQVGKSAQNLELRSLIKFDISSIPPSDSVINATLKLYISYASNTSSNILVHIYRISSSWNELEVGWNNKTASNLWTSSGGDYLEQINSTILNSTGWYNISITSSVRNWVNGSSNNYGLILIADNPASGDYKEISSSASADQSLVPKLEINYLENAPPDIALISSDSNLSNPKAIGNSVTFSVVWSDLENDASNIFVCNSSNITPSGCTDKTFCSISSASSSPSQCSYAVLDSDSRASNFFISACEGNCSAVSNSTFYMNHPPSIKIVQPNGGETLNQSQGNYTVKFNVSDADADSLTAGIYYGTSKNSASNLISNLNLTNYCSGLANTTKNCSYQWDTTGLYGQYFITIILNDTFATSQNSSNSSFNVYSLIDNQAPQILSQLIDSSIYSGKNTTISAEINEPNMQRAWAAINTTPQTNVTLFNISENSYSGTFLAPSVGNYKFKVYAIDTIGNLNDTMPWQEFSVSKPSASVQNSSSPATALPYSVIKVSSDINATDALHGVYAYLNIPSGFTFLSGYYQNAYLGNFSAGQGKTATWFLSAPLTASSYLLNVTFTDAYSNSWQSPNFNISVTNAMGGYLLSLSGYTEVETSKNYYSEALFSQNGQPVPADSVYVSLYDPTGNLVSGPATMSLKSTGAYNYSYTVGPSVTEGQWETVVNATKSSVSYFANQFWNVVGGPFDIRSITIINSAVNSLNISFIAQNTGGANKDLILVWNLTRVDTGQALDSGSETFMVNANSEKTWYINPSTDYIGQVQITLLGYYSVTEKAGAYKIFSTTSAENKTNQTNPISAPSPSGGGGGGGTASINKKSDFNILFENPINLTKNIEKTVILEIENTGETSLSDINLSLGGLDAREYKITPLSIISLNQNKTNQFQVKFLVSDISGEKDFYFVVSSKELTKKFPAQLNVMSMNDFFAGELKRLREKSSLLGKNATSDFFNSLKQCNNMIDSVELNIQKEEYISAEENINSADKCLDDLSSSMNKVKEIPFAGINFSDYWAWIVTWALILILIVVLIVIIYVIYKKIGIASFMKKEEQVPRTKRIEKDFFNERIQNIEKKLGRQIEPEKNPENREDAKLGDNIV